MTIYIIPYFYFLFSTIIEIFFGKKKILSLIGAIILIVIAGFRYEVDKDYTNYIYFFELIKNLDYNLNSIIQSFSDIYFEPLFQLLIAALKNFFPISFLFIIIAFLSIFCYTKVFFNETKIPSAAFLIYYSDAFIIREFTQIRFGLAVSVAFVAMYFLRKKKTWKYLSLGFASTFIHYTCGVIFLLPLWIKLTSSKKQLIIISTIGLMISISGVLSPLIHFLTSSSFSPERLLHYSETFNAESANKLYIITHYFMVILIYQSTKLMSDEKIMYYFKIYTFFFFLLCLVSEFDLLRRLSFVFSTSLYIIVPLILKKRKFIAVALIFIYSLFLLIYSRLSIVAPYNYHSII